MVLNRNFIEKIKLPEAIRIPFFGGKWYHLTSAWDFRKFQKEQIPEHPLNTQPRTEKIIASLTSYPARIPFVHLAIKSLLLQSCPPDRIQLCLAKEQFPDRKLPAELTELTKFGLEICWMDDLYGHKKYFYAVRNQQSDEVVITFDDDIIFPHRAIERLMNTHRKYPHCLVCERGQVLRISSLYNPGRWQTISDVGVKEPVYSMNPSPGGGCLIPYGAFYFDALDTEKIRSLAYKNDDLWYMFMCAQNGTRMVKTRKYHRLFTLIPGSQTEQMATQNIRNNYNEVVMKQLIQTYPSAWERICPVSATNNSNGGKSH